MHTVDVAIAKAIFDASSHKLCRYLPLALLMTSH